MGLTIEGFDDFKLLLNTHVEAAISLKTIKVVIYNTCEYAPILEFGSNPGDVENWPHPGLKTEYASDVFLNGRKIVSIQGFAMLQVNMEEVQNYLAEELAKVDLGENLRAQVIEIFLKAGAIWLKNARIGTPVDSGEAQNSWYTELIDN